MAEDTQTWLADDFRRRFIDSVADGEAPDLEQLQAGRLSFQTGREVVRLG